MNTKRTFLRPSLQLALASVFAALVCVTTITTVVTIPPNGYFNVGEVVIYTAAILFGPFVGSIAGGVGAAAADMMGFALFAPGTLVIKGVEGAIVGFLSSKIYKRTGNLALSATISIIIGGLEMVAGYFIYEQLVVGYTFFNAIAEVPFNILQMLIGLAIALPITYAVLRVFPQLKS